jgi:hypothetical protein
LRVIIEDWIAGLARYVSNEIQDQKHTFSRIDSSSYKEDWVIRVSDSKTTIISSNVTVKGISRVDLSYEYYGSKGLDPWFILYQSANYLVVYYLGNFGDAIKYSGAYVLSRIPGWIPWTERAKIERAISEANVDFVFKDMCNYEQESLKCSYSTDL